jgi:hypothetical protein
MEVDWKLKEAIARDELKAAGFLLLVCAAAIAYMTESWWGYAGAAVVALYGAVAMGAKIET